MGARKGTKHTPATRQRMRLSALARDNTRRIAALPRGSTHWNWSPDANRLTLHKRLHRKFGKASSFACHDCPKNAYDWSNETGVYSDDIKDYVPRCRSCHVKKDKNWIKRIAA